MPILRPSLMEPVLGDDEITYAARDLRASLLGSIFSREGVIDLRGGHLRVTQRGQGANMTVDIAPGRAAVFGDDAADQGTYEVNSTTTLNRPIPAPSQSSSRTHRVILRIRDRSENGAWAPNTYDAVVEVQPDTTAVADLPPSAIPLAEVTTPARASSVTTDMIRSLRDRASVGTKSLIGDVAAASGWGSHAQNPIRYSVTPDGVVLLSGQIMRTGPTITLNAATNYSIATLPEEVRPAWGSTLMILGWGHRFGAVSIPRTGVMAVSFSSSQQFPQNVGWLTLDGLTYQLGA